MTVAPYSDNADAKTPPIVPVGIKGRPQGYNGARFPARRPGRNREPQRAVLDTVGLLGGFQVSLQAAVITVQVDARWPAPARSLARCSLAKSIRPFLAASVSKRPNPYRNPRSRGEMCLPAAGNISPLTHAKVSTRPPPVAKLRAPVREPHPETAVKVINERIVVIDDDDHPFPPS